ncbi:MULTISPECIES: 2TM domain-containing protein [unclassified Polaribacter]|uniref:2TM domain-containing protein n=1 Tax=unclassified Polaribacter TaxID=196858 RepID=UPI0011BF81ED|nr:MULTISPECIES: 2TM domain-containing protein [unclassified Polaribacter]TXD52877.1 2TM domain-containing protein [Polaribacter sp. IC063]TXD60823.1 2TM domain-containing protein [Polaribacter sp. IC066]
MDRKFTQDQKYVLVRKRVEKISKFYKHLASYVIVNIFLTAIFIAGDVNDGDTFSEALFDYHNYKIWMYWGIGIAFQALNTFGFNLFFNKSWEERKIKRYMEEQNNRR